MRRRNLYGAVAGACAPAMAVVLLLAGAAPSAAQDVVTVAQLTGPANEAVAYALEKKIITSPKVRVEVSSLTIPALIQATGTKQYDIVQTAVVGIPLLRARGVEVRIVGVGSKSMETNPETAFTGLYVRADSPMKDSRDLKGKTVAVSALRATDATYMQLALAKKYGLNIDLHAGDIKWVEIPLESIPAMIQQGKVDAGYMFGLPAYRARHGKELRPLFFSSVEYTQMTGARTVYSVLVSYPDRLEKKGEAIREAVRLLRASREYLDAHREEVFAAVGRKHNVDRSFFDANFSVTEPLSVAIEPEDERGIETFWRLAKEAGRIPAIPALADLVWR